jgi:hypothetical protein
MFRLFQDVVYKIFSLILCVLEPSTKSLVLALSNLDPIQGVELTA